MLISIEATARVCRCAVLAFLLCGPIGPIPLATADQKPAPISAKTITNTTANTTASTDATVASILHILDYVAVDYPGVVHNGAIVNSGEYIEQKEFITRLMVLVNQLPDSGEKPMLREASKGIQDAIAQLKPGEEVTAACMALTQRFISVYNIRIAPRIAPTLAQGKTLFAENCAMCHGAHGFGDGPNAASLDPVPANFHDRERQQHRNVYSLYNTISLGVQGTAMPAFTRLSNQQRWELAFYVSNFYAGDSEREAGELVWTQTKDHPAIADLAQLTQLTPQQMMQSDGEPGANLLAYLRANPTKLQTGRLSPVHTAQDKLEASVEAYAQNDSAAAYDLAVAAYLEGFELAETKLNSVAPQLRIDIEQKMMAYRDMIKQGAPLPELKEQQQELMGLLDSAKDSISSSQASSAVSFFSAFLILLREGVEAILILAAISAVLIKTGRRESLRYIHFGWITALALGFLTWYVAGHVITISGANRELTEGLTALVAAAMLVYVGFWLHKQSYAMQWKHFIKNKINQSITDGALTGLAMVAFLAVYREVFESVLFFQTLWLQTQESGQGFVTGGALSALAMLVLVAWVIFKFSVRLPLKLFFTINTLFLYLLAVVFVGKGVAGLQEAGKLPRNYIEFFQVDALGIYPNLESLGMQVLMIVVAVMLYGYTRMKVNRNLSLNT